MGVLEKALWTGGAVLVAAALGRVRRTAQETRRRINSPLQFDDGITAEEFAELAATTSRGMPRLQGVQVRGMNVTIQVRSNSGLSMWTAKVDFNDYGHLTGNYWLSSENADSVIPEHFARLMQTEIVKRLASSPSRH